MWKAGDTPGEQGTTGHPVQSVHVCDVNCWSSTTQLLHLCRNCTCHLISSGAKGVLQSDPETISTRNVAVQIHRNHRSLRSNISKPFQSHQIPGLCCWRGLCRCLFRQSLAIPTWFLESPASQVTVNSCTYNHIYIYIYTEREREIEKV